MYTRCPDCATCFRVTDRHLAIANGKVRCGQCSAIFNAKDFTVDRLPGETTTPAQQTTPAVASTPAQPTPEPPRTTEKSEQLSTTDETAINISSETESALTDNIVPTESVPQKPAADNSSNDFAQTMIVDSDHFEIDQPSDTPSEHSKHHFNFDDEEDDDIFSDSFEHDIDLDSAIANMTGEPQDDFSDTQDDITATNNFEDTLSDPDNILSVETTHNNASSVANILEEMQGQLALNITDEPEQEKAYNPDDEFEFLELDDEDDEPEISVVNAADSFDSLITDEFEIDLYEDKPQQAEQFDEFEVEPDEIEETEPDEHITKPVTDNKIDEDELFDQVDLSDFQESGIEDSININDINPSSFTLNNNVSIQPRERDSQDDVPFKLRNNLERLEAQPTSRWRSAGMFLLFILLLGISFIQLALFRSHELLHLIPQSQALLSEYCAVMPCKYSGPQDIKQIKLINRNVQLHPKEKNALLISASMINKAKFAQPYPKIHIKLSDISGNLVAERIFSAKTYMGKHNNPFLLMKSNTPVHVNFEVIDPGKDAVNFEFKFR